MRHFIFAFTLIISSISLTLDFSEGPYGSEYFNIAGPMQLEDLNALPKGDVNDDGMVNVLDIVTIVNMILN